MLANDYGNKIMPLIVWEHIRSFLQRMLDCWNFDNRLYQDNINIRGNMTKIHVDGVSSTINRFNKLFCLDQNNPLPDANRQSLYQKKEYSLEIPDYEVGYFSKTKIKGFNLKITYYVYNGPLKDNGQLPNNIGELLKDGIEFVYYHLARKEIAPDEYKEGTEKALAFLTNDDSVKAQLKEQFKTVKDDVIDAVKDKLKELVRNELVALMNKVVESLDESDRKLVEENKQALEKILQAAKDADVDAVFGDLKKWLS